MNTDFLRRLRRTERGAGIVWCGPRSRHFTHSSGKDLRPPPGLFALALALIPLAGCSGDTAPQSARVTVGEDREFQVEVADTPQLQSEGLSGRQDLPAGTGMLIAFEPGKEREVWMAGMEIPIDIAWIADGQVLQISTLDPCTENRQSLCPRWRSPGAADALLEVPADALNGITPGTPVSIREEQQ